MGNHAQVGRKLDNDGLNPVGSTDDGLGTAASVFAHPDEVIDAHGLTTAEKRAILASWMSDAHAVESKPTLRQLDSGAVVRLDHIQHALMSLDGSEVADPGVPRTIMTKLQSFARRRRGMTLSRRGRGLRWRKPDDDDPPPSPVGLPPPLRPVPGTSAAVRTPSCCMAILH